MDKDDKPTPAPDHPRIGQDEINLTEFPIALLSDRAPRGNPSLRRFTNGNKVWEIVGHAGHGLPTRLDMEVYVVLTELTREQGFPERVQFSRHDLLRRLGWGADARRYARLQQALDCWVGVTIQTTNSFYDKEKGEWLNRHAFHLLEEYSVTEARGLGAAGRSDEAALSWFRWSETIRRNMRARYLKPLDVELFLTFRSAVTQALYRYLDAKRLNGKPTFQQSLVDLGKQHLGLPSSYYPSQIKRELDVAHEELIATGFLADAHYEPMRGSSGEKVVYQFAPKAGVGVGRWALGVGDGPIDPDAQCPTPNAQRPTPNADPLVQQLLEHGVTAGIAAELAAGRREECERQLSYLPYRDGLQNPAGALRRAIEEAWPAPEAWQKAQRKRRDERARGRRGDPMSELAPSPPRPLDPDPAAAAAAFDAWWSALSEGERVAIDQAAAAQLPDPASVAGQHLARHPAARERLLRELRGRLRGEG
jgi:hypothetical protein